MVKILVACANGAGSSLMMKMAAERAFKEMDIPVQEIHHCALAEGVSSANQFDLVFVAQNFLNMYDSAIQQGAKVIGLRNIMSDKEIIEKVKEAGYDKLYK
ncbi:MAG: PTS sugar transporter subunit IIB [Clostridiaceae bacterium]|nr:PTS sugar transporter subunit IIB [Clostridiaceae bacterium]